MIIKHRTFTTYAWDLGIFNQAFYTTTTLGKTFYYTCELHFVQSGSFFGIHFSPILYAILPVYSLFPGPETLLIIESLILALAAYPLFLISTKLLDSQKGLLISIIYLANPVIQGINSYDFHVQIFFPILIFSAQYLFLEEKWIEHLVAVLLVLMIQEQAVYIIFFYGVSLIVSNFSNIIKGFRDKQFLSFQILTPFIVLLMSISWFFVSSSVIHFFNPEIPIELKAGKNLSSRCT